MFTTEELENDNYFINFAFKILTQDPYKVGRFVDIYSHSILIEKICKAHFEEVKYLSKHNLYLIRTNDLGLGYSSYLSPIRLHELIELGKVDKDIPIEFKYQHGNIFIYINIKDIDSKLLLINEIYFVVNKSTNKICYIVIGRPTRPNFLYYRSDLNGFKSTLDKVRTIQNFNRIDIYENIKNNFI